MARIFVTGSADGLGRLVASALMDQGHDMIVHVRGEQRLASLTDLVSRGATAVVGDLGDRGQAAI